VTAEVGIGGEEEINASAAWQADVDIAGPGTKPDEPGLARRDHVLRLSDDGRFYAPSRERTYTGPPLCDRHMLPDCACAAAGHVRQRHQHDTLAALGLIAQEAQ
jgi:hypothetical protein